MAREFDLASKLVELEEPVPSEEQQPVSVDSHFAVQAHMKNVKLDTLQKLRGELLQLESENFQTFERLKLESASLKRRSERVAQQKSLIEEVLVACLFLLIPTPIRNVLGTHTIGFVRR